MSSLRMPVHARGEGQPGSQHPESVPLKFSGVTSAVENGKMDMEPKLRGHGTAVSS